MRVGVQELKTLAGFAVELLVFELEALLEVSAQQDEPLAMIVGVPTAVRMWVDLFTCWNFGNQHRPDLASILQAAEVFYERPHYRQLLQRRIPHRFVLVIEANPNILGVVVAQPDVWGLPVRATATGAVAVFAPQLRMPVHRIRDPLCVQREA